MTARPTDRHGTCRDCGAVWSNDHLMAAGRNGGGNSACQGCGYEPSVHAGQSFVVEAWPEGDH